MVPRMRRLVGSPRLRRAATRVRRVTRFAIAHKVTAGLVLLIGLAPPVSAGLWLDSTRDNWGVEDWVALMAGQWTAFWFLVLAVVLGVDSQRRARALADAEVSRTVGALAVAGSRSFAGADSQALRIPSDALAALQHYEAAGQGQQRALLTAIQTALADVVFGTVCRADALPRSIWERLCTGTENLHKRLTWLFDGEPDEQRRGELEKTRALVRLCYELGTALRRDHWSLKSRGQLDLSHVLRPPRADGEEQDKCADARYALGVLERLYAQELAVVKQWAVLRRCLEPGRGSTPAVKVTVTLEDVHRAERWCTPWCVSRENEQGKRTELHAVNVNKQVLNEAAHADRLPQDQDLPVWPTPLLHGQVPEEMRRGGVERARALLEEQPQPVTVCALLYELAPAPTGEAPQRLVLDGNHRLAGALRFTCSRAQGEDGDGSGDGCPVRVLAFTIKEQTPVVDPAVYKKRRRDRIEIWEWKGFTPDVQNLRSDEADEAELRARQKGVQLEESRS